MSTSPVLFLIGVPYELHYYTHFPTQARIRKMETKSSSKSMNHGERPAHSGGGLPDPPGMVRERGVRDLPESYRYSVTRYADLILRDAFNERQTLW